MTTRRSVVAALGAGSLTALSGCLGFVTGSEPAEFSSEPAHVPESVLSQTGYSSNGNDEMVIEEELEAMGISRQVVVTNYQTEYEKAVDLGPLGNEQAAVFTALTTPQASVLGREFNPVADMSSRELAEMVQDNYDGFGELDHLDDDTVTINETDTTVSTFETKATLTGIDETIDLRVLITESVELGDDLLVTVGGYPEMTTERDNILQLMANVVPAE